jgi:hypothetical protein
MIYIVSGLWRSGTSMMMKALQAGGMPISYTMKQTDYVALHGYEPTPGGVFETDRTELTRSDFVQVYDGRVLKVPYTDLFSLPAHEYKLIFMLRSPESIRKSMLKYAPTALFPQEDLTWFYSQVIDTLSTLQGGFELLWLNYENVVSQPFIEFERIRTFGIPINIGKAASVVDAHLQRNETK